MTGRRYILEVSSSTPALEISDQVFDLLAEHFDTPTRNDSLNVTNATEDIVGVILEGGTWYELVRPGWPAFELEVIQGR